MSRLGLRLGGQRDVICGILLQACRVGFAKPLRGPAPPSLPLLRDCSSPSLAYSLILLLVGNVHSPNLHTLIKSMSCCSKEVGMLRKIGLQKVSLPSHAPFSNVTSVIALDEIVQDSNGFGIIAVANAELLLKCSTAETVVDAHCIRCPRKVEKRPSQKFQTCDHRSLGVPLAPSLDVNVASIWIPIPAEQGVQHRHCPKLHGDILGLLVLAFAVMLNNSTVMTKQFET